MDPVDNAPTVKSSDASMRCSLLTLPAPFLVHTRSTFEIAEHPPMPSIAEALHMTSCSAETPELLTRTVGFSASPATARKTNRERVHHHPANRHGQPQCPNIFGVKTVAMDKRTRSALQQRRGSQFRDTHTPPLPRLVHPQTPWTFGLFFTSPASLCIPP